MGSSKARESFSPPLRSRQLKCLLFLDIPLRMPDIGKIILLNSITGKVLTETILLIIVKAPLPRLSCKSGGRSSRNSELYLKLRFSYGKPPWTLWRRRLTYTCFMFLAIRDIQYVNSTGRIPNILLSFAKRLKVIKNIQNGGI